MVVNKLNRNSKFNLRSRTLNPWNVCHVHGEHIRLALNRNPTNFRHAILHIKQKCSSTMRINNRTFIRILLIIWKIRFISLNLVDPHHILIAEFLLNSRQCTFQRNVKFSNFAFVHRLLPRRMRLIAALQRPFHRFKIFLKSLLIGRNVKIILVLISNLRPRIQKLLRLRRCHILQLPRLKNRNRPRFLRHLFLHCWF